MYYQIFGLTIFKIIKSYLKIWQDSVFICQILFDSNLFHNPLQQKFSSFYFTGVEPAKNTLQQDCYTLWIPR